MRGLVQALDALVAGCADFSAELTAGSVHEHAFGKLIDATKVCDAYHDRLPATKANLAEAREVAADFLAEFAAPPVPAQREPREPRESQVPQESQDPRG